MRINDGKACLRHHANVAMKRQTGEGKTGKRRKV
jgi:hypothetical protein